MLICGSGMTQASDETSISLSAGCDLFMRYVTRTSALEYEDISAGKARLIERGERFGEISLKVSCLYFVCWKH
jgi:translation initiation factor eIF-2B subunit alpha